MSNNIVSFPASMTFAHKCSGPAQSRRRTVPDYLNEEQAALHGMILDEMTLAGAEFTPTAPGLVLALMVTMTQAERHWDLVQNCNDPDGEAAIALAGEMAIVPIAAHALCLDAPAVGRIWEWMDVEFYAPVDLAAELAKFEDDGGSPAA